MPAYVVDIEADALLDDVTKIHVLSYTPINEFKPTSLFTYEEMMDFLNQEDLTIIGHNFINYDIKVLRKVLGYEGNPRIICTLSLSWFLESSNGRVKHGLEAHGEDLGVAKVKVGDDEWGGLSEDELNIIDYYEKRTA